MGNEPGRQRPEGSDSSPRRWSLRRQGSGSYLRSNSRSGEPRCSNDENVTHTQSTRSPVNNNQEVNQNNATANSISDIIPSETNPSASASTSSVTEEKVKDKQRSGSIDLDKDIASGDESDSSDSDIEEVEESSKVPTVTEPGQRDTILESVQEILQRQDHSRFNEHDLMTIQKLRDFVENNEEEVNGVATKMIALNYPELICDVVKPSLNSDEAGADYDPEGLKTSWEILDLVYHMLVKVTDKSRDFCKAVVATDMMAVTIDCLKKETHRSRCTNEPYGRATSWMIELVGNCYDNMSQEDAKRKEFKEVIQGYMTVENQLVQMKTGQTLLMMALKDRLHSSLGYSGGEGSDGHPPRSPSTSDLAASVQELRATLESSNTNISGLFDGILEELNPEVKTAKEAKHMYDIGMPKVYCENIKGWLRDTNKWIAFNQDGKMWDCVHEWFGKVAVLSKASEQFCTAMCEAGIVGPLLEILGNEQISEAYMRNTKKKKVPTATLR